MKTSFIVIAYNEEKNIKQCIHSIQRQDYLTDYEIIVINDASTDKTQNKVLEIKNSNAIKLLNLEKNSGRGKARLEGIKIAKGEYIAFVDADIILPEDWFQICKKYLGSYDGVGGIAIPDGDVVYIFNKCKLKARIKKHTTELTGNNCIFQRQVFDSIKIDEDLTEGEDVDLVWRMKKVGFQVKSISDLVVKHNESKSYIRSLKWLFQSGIGATKLLFKFNKIRIPDLTFFLFVMAAAISFPLYIQFKSILFLSIPILFVFLTSAFHIYSKFNIKISNLYSFIWAILLNFPLMFVYFLGRITGLFLYKKS